MAPLHNRMLAGHGSVLEMHSAPVRAPDLHRAVARDREYGARTVLLTLTLAGAFAMPARAGQTTLCAVEEDGRVVFEAEEFSARSPVISGHEWLIVPQESAGVAPRAVFRGTGYIQSLPDNNSNTGGLNGSFIEYRMSIQTTGTYRLFARWDGHNGSSDSFFASIVELSDGAGGSIPDWWELVPPCGSVPLTDGNFTTTPWHGNGFFEGSTACGGGSAVTWTIPAAGVYTLRVFPREDGVAIDAFVFQRTTLPAPTGNGPPASLGGVCDECDTGACCIGSGCLDFPESMCNAFLGVFRGLGTSCATDACPTGGCCIGDFTCEVFFTESTCLSFGGEYLGDGASCDACGGACCLDDGVCVPVSAAICSGFGGSFTAGTACPAGCPATTGACCLEPAGCQADVTPEACAGLGGFYIGDGTTCTQCVVGACCLDDLQLCFPLPEGLCAATDGTYLPGQECDTSPCGFATGACLLETGCTESTLGECLLFYGGLYQGDGTTCNMAWCCRPGDGGCALIDEVACLAFGAAAFENEADCAAACPVANCCFAGICLETNEQHCLANGGEFDVSCVDGECAPGACCLGLTGCIEASACACAFIGGAYLGTGTTCAAGFCGSGACCLADGTCTADSTAPDCATAGGTFAGFGSTCATAFCVIGACCYGGGACLSLSAQSCATIGGAYGGDGTACGGGSCTASRLSGACCLAAGGCSDVPAGDCAAAGGTYQGDGTGCIPDGCEVGACCFPSGLCQELTLISCNGFGGSFQGGGSECASALCPEFELDNPAEFPAAGVPVTIVTRGFATTANPKRVEADFDGANGPDAAIVLPDAGQTAGRVEILINEGLDPGGWLGLKTGQTVVVGPVPTDADVADVDDDGDVDVVVSNSGDGTISVLRSVGVPPDIVFEVQSFPTGGGALSSIAAGFIDTRAAVDFVVTDADANEVIVIEGSTFTPIQTIGTGGELPGGIAILDMDTEIKCPDVIGINTGMRGQPGSVFRMLNVGGTLQFAGTTPVGVEPRDLAVGDLDGDGRRDVAVVNGGDLTVTVLLNPENTTLDRVLDIPIGDDPRSVEIEDVSGDGVNDLIVVANDDVGQAVVKVLVNLTQTPGTPLFDVPVEFSVDDNPQFLATPGDVATADFDVDDTADVVTANDDEMIPSGGSVSVLLGRVCIGDLDGDGMVSDADLQIILESFGPCGVACPEDLDGDGFVTFGDTLILLGDWGICP
ncbi:MAG: VCBS repeat-containing protein [Planctomycetes bacterium]|nr:VCBS repeat-containing protein [Planctomycetota bacterium]